MKVQEELFTVHLVKTKSCSSYCDRTSIALQLFNYHFGREFESSLTLVQINKWDHGPLKKCYLNVDEFMNILAFCKNEMFTFNNGYNYKHNEKIYCIKCHYGIIIFISILYNYLSLYICMIINKKFI